MKSVLLLSGGLDSATVCSLMKKEDREIYALTIDYNQRHRAELEAARNIAKFNQVKEHVILPVDLTKFGGSALTDKTIEIPETPQTEIGKEIPTTYVPARNLVFLSLALAFAETRQADEIWLGVNSVDYNGYPDCRPEFVNAFQGIANIATKIGIEKGIEIRAPLLSLTKNEIISEGLKAGVDYSLTRTCYRLDEKGRSCGRCESCRLRQEAFLALGMKDPAPYV